MIVLKGRGSVRLGVAVIVLNVVEKLDYLIKGRFFKVFGIFFSVDNMEGGVEIR